MLQASHCSRVHNAIKSNAHQHVCKYAFAGVCVCVRTHTLMKCQSWTTNNNNNNNTCINEMSYKTASTAVLLLLLEKAYMQQNRVYAKFQKL